MTELKNKIFVKNLFYMLAYFFHLPESISNDLNDKEFIDHPFDLLAEIFVIKLNTIRSKGFNKNYTHFNESGNFIKGKIDVIKTEERKRFNEYKFFLEYEELNHNTIQNQYIKHALKILIINKKLINQVIIQKVLNTYRTLVSVSDVNFSEDDFLKVKRTNKLDYYNAPLFLANLIINAFIPNQDRSMKGIKFDFSRKIFPRIFEGFVTNFYIKHMHEIEAIKVIKQKNITWDFTEFT